LSEVEAAEWWTSLGDGPQDGGLSATSLNEDDLTVAATAAVVAAALSSDDGEEKRRDIPRCCGAAVGTELTGKHGPQLFDETEGA
jgi:hypothetical protein